MTQQEIKLSGLAAIPDDYQSPDGQLDASLNLIGEDNHLRPLFQPKVILDVDHNINYNPQVVFVHTTSAFKHYIVKTDSNVVYWMNSNTDPNNPSATFIYDFGQHTIHSFNAVGNTLCVLCEDGIHYILWKGDTYKYLGNHLPELPLTFSLEAKAVPVLGNEFRVNIGVVPSQYKPSSGESIYFKDMPSYDEAKINEVSNNVLGHVNKFIYDNATHAGRFIFPFFVRYAFRLYDGSLTMHSAPILMVTTSWCSPQAFITNWVETTHDNETFITDVDVLIGALVHQLSYKVRDNAFKTELQQYWSDIVKSVDIFISAPIYTYNQAGKIEGWCELNKRAKGYTLSRIKKSDSLASITYWPSNYDQDEDYCKWWVTPHIINYYNVGDRGKEELILPHFSDDAVKTAISDCGNFYFLKAINIDDIAQDDDDTSRTIIDIPEDYLSSLTSREVMSDDYDSHDLLIPQRSHTFNSRINLFGLSKVLANPICPSAYVCWTNNSFSDVNDSDTWVDNGASYYKLFVHIKQDGREIIVAYNSSDNLKLGSKVDFPFIYFYYHNPNAYKLTLVVYNNRDLTDTPTVYSLPLERHSMLNGAFFFQGWNPDISTITSSPDASSDRTISLPNKFYTSEVNNPFFFPVTGINTIGTGTINGIATVTEPLSQGQFGYADIYVFCSDGIWVAQINQQGKISNINPVNKDVCTNPKSITQLGTSVLYVTQRGIMQLYGRNVECISDIIANEHPFNHLTNLPKLDSLNTSLPTIAPFSDFLSNCRMLYDYIHQRIIVFNPLLDEHQHLDGYETIGGGIIGYDDNNQPIYDVLQQVPIYSYTYTRHFPYAYVFSLRSKLWGMMDSNLASSLNSYPECLAMDQDNNLVSFDNPITTNPVDGIAITRPIKFGSPDTLKSVYELIQRGVFNRGDVKTILYGSRDLEHWHLIASSTSHAIRGLRGTPYKYFRLVAVSSLADNQSLAGTTFVVEPRHTNVIH